MRAYPLLSPRGEGLLAGPGKSADFVSREPLRRRREESKGLWNFPPALNPMLPGQPGMVQDLRRQLQSQPVLGVVGIAGVGKTQLAVAYAHRHADDYDVMWWVRARRAETLASDLAALSERLGLGEGTSFEAARINAVREWLESHERWLVVLDDADPDIWPTVVPTTGPGHLLVTTSTSLPVQRAAWIEVDRLSREDAVAWFLARTGDGTNADQLCEALGDLPLAVEIAAAYVNARRDSLAGYLDGLRRRTPELFARNGPHDHHAVATTCAITFEHLQRSSHGAWDLLRLCAFLAPGDIPLELLARGAAALPKASQRSLKLPDGAVAVLHRFSLVARSGDALFLHHLIQEAVRDILGHEGRRTWSAIAVRTLEATFTEEGDDANRSQRNRLLPHLLATVGHPEASLAEPDITSALLERVADHLQAEGQFARAGEYRDLALEIAESAHKGDHDKPSVEVLPLESADEVGRPDTLLERWRRYRESIN